MEDFHQIFDVLERQEEMVIATIVRVQGSAYKKEGAAMVFLADGTQIGMLTAGCLETDLSIKVQEVFKHSEPVLFQYDLYEEDDWGWGQGIGCNGTIDILLEPVNDQLKRDLLLVKEIIASHKPVIGLKKLDDLGEYVFLEEDGEPFGNWSGPVPIIEFTSKSGLISSEGPAVFQHTYQPRPRLIVFGASPDAVPLVKAAAATGFSVIVCDWREEYCNRNNFPDADQLLVDFPISIFQQFTFSPYDFVVVMTHHFRRDQEIINRLINKNIRYLGVLGPKERTKRLLRCDRIPAWIHSPIGVSIGAKGQEEIAISIVAELINVWRKPQHERLELFWTIPKSSSS